MFRLYLLLLLGLVACAPVPQEVVRFDNGLTQLEGTLYTPRGRGPFPAVVLTHGSGPDGRHNSTFSYHATILARRGIAALAYDKRGVGGSTGDWRYVSLSDLADDALAAVETLASRPDIDARRIGIWGGSQGGWVAPLAASRSGRVAFVITAAGSVWSPAQLAKWRSLIRVREAGFDETAQRAAVHLMDVQAEQIHQRGWEDGWHEYRRLAAPYRDEPWFGLLSQLRNELNDTSWFMPYTSDIDFDVKAVLNTLEVPVLAFLGGSDPLVPAEETAAALDSIRRATGRDITVVVLEGAGHSMTPEGSGQPVREYTRTLLRWTRAQTRKPH